MIIEEMRERLSHDGYDGVILFDNQSYDKSLIGVTADGRAVYDYDRMVAEYMEDNGCDEMEAIEWIDYNTIGAVTAGGFLPIVLIRNDDDEMVDAVTDEKVDIAYRIQAA